MLILERTPDDAKCSATPVSTPATTTTTLVDNPERGKQVCRDSELFPTGCPEKLPGKYLRRSTTMPAKPNGGGGAVFCRTGKLSTACLARTNAGDLKQGVGRSDCGARALRRPWVRHTRFLVSFQRWGVSPAPRSTTMLSTFATAAAPAEQRPCYRQRQY